MKIKVLLIGLMLGHWLIGQTNPYEHAYTELKAMLEGKTPLSFKKAVFTVENAYYNNALNYAEFEQRIKELSVLATAFYNSNPIQNYSFADSTDIAKNGAIFTLMTDTLYLTKGVILHSPFYYDFDDFFGAEDWSKQFVTKLLNTHSGNCHSMPYLYKILAEELNTTAHLAFAPNHIYIKRRSKNPEIGFYNTELTSKCFPVDAWIMTSGYVSLETIGNKLYMDTLSNKQSIAINLIDLAEGHQRQDTANLDFVLKCCDLALKYYPNYANGLLLRAETLKAKVMATMELFGTLYPSEMLTDDKAVKLYRAMEQAYTTLAQLGYREVPQSVYLKWLEELANNMDKYTNQKITNFNNE